MLYARVYLSMCGLSYEEPTSHGSTKIYDPRRARASTGGKLLAT